MGGTRSGQSLTLISQPLRMSGETVAVSPERETRAPRRASAPMMTRSPCELERLRPVTLTPLPRAPAASQKAALDQSPSTSTPPGDE